MGFYRGLVRWLVLLGNWWGPGLALAQEPPPLELSLHARTTSSSARAERAAWLSITLPLDELARPKLLPVANPSEPAASPPASIEATSSSLAVAGVGATPALSFAQLQTLAEFSRRACAVALAVAGVPVERRRLDSIATRARASAALPEIRLRAQRNTDQALRWAPTSDDPYRVTQADGAGTTFEVSATFHLDRLLFAREELNVARLRQQAGVEHIKLERRVLDALLELLRARELSCSPSADAEARGSVLLRGAERFIELDVMTAGWFSAQAARLSRALWGFPEAVLGVCSEPPPASAPAATNPVASLEHSG
jgi:hypothetical protein